MDAYFLSQLGYCSLVWMSHSRTVNSCINGFDKRALTIVHSDFSLSFSELLKRDKSVPQLGSSMKYVYT